MHAITVTIGRAMYRTATMRRHRGKRWASRWLRASIELTSE